MLAHSETDCLCYCDTNPAESSEIHYLAGAMHVTVCGQTPVQRLPHLPIEHLGQRHDPTGQEGWSWCQYCTASMGATPLGLPEVKPKVRRIRRKRNGASWQPREDAVAT